MTTPPTAGTQGLDHPFARCVNPPLARLLHDVRMDKRFVRGDGPWLWDHEGRRYLDFIANYGALPFGYNPPRIWKALMEAQARGEPSFVQPSALEAAGELARRLVELAPEGLQYVTFANSGAEAVEAAIKMARAATGRLRLLSTHNSFHGKTLGALSATGRPAYQQPFGAPVEGFDFVPYGDVEALERVLDERGREYAALILEPIQGEGGIVVPPPGYLKAARELTRRHGVLLIADEVQTGLGRTGRLFACQEEGVAPDIMTLAKALGGGLVPIGACLATEQAFTEEFGMRHSSTFAGGALACRAGLATLEWLTEAGGALLQQVRERGRLLLEGLQELARRHPRVIREARGRGLMLGIDFAIAEGGRQGYGRLLQVMSHQELLTPVIASHLLNAEGLRVAPTLNGQSVLRIEPALIVGEPECRTALAAIERVVALLDRGETGALLRHLAAGEQPDGRAGRAPVRAATPREQETAPEQPAGDGPGPVGAEGRFAFLVHPLDLQNYREFDPALEALDDDELAELTERFNPLMEPFVLSDLRITSATGERAYGEFVAVPRTTRQLLELPRSEALPLVRDAVALARERGARIVGLGAYTAIVSRGGLHLTDLGVALTTGNSYTVATAIEALLEGARRLGFDPEDCTAAVVGAGGSIGRATALLLAPRVKGLWLVGNPASGQRAWMRLQQVAAEIAALAPAADGRASKVALSTDVSEALPRSTLVVAATSTADAFISPEHLAPGAVVCDLSRPPNVSRRVDRERPDVLVLDGGVVEIPGRPDFGWNFGYEAGLAYACMAETMMLALEQHYRHTGLGADLDPAVVRWTQELAARHGFRVAGLRSFDRPLSQERWQRLLEARRAALSAGLQRA